MKIKLENKTIFITGVAGFIGSNLAERLLSTITNVKVIGIDNLNNYYDKKLKESRISKLRMYPNFIFIKGNIADKPFVQKLFDLYGP